MDKLFEVAFLIGFPHGYKFVNRRKKLSTYELLESFLSITWKLITNYTQLIHRVIHNR